MNQKRFIAALAVLLLLLFAVGGTLAYLIDTTDPLVNTFTPTSVNVEITDKIEDGVKQNVVITNTGKTSAYIRARIVGSWVKDDVIVAPWDSTQGTFTTKLPEDGWVAGPGGYYYHTAPVEPDRTTSPLFTTYTPPEAPVPGAHLVLDILVQAIQSEGDAAEEAWDWTPGTNQNQ